MVCYDKQAEEVEFNFTMIFDHYHSWTTGKKQFFCTKYLCGISQVTNRIPIGTGVTGPTFRMRPAIVLHAAVASMFSGRFIFGVWPGEILNEQYSGQ